MTQEQIKKVIDTIGGFTNKSFAPYGLFQLSWIAIAIIVSIFAFKLCYKKHLRRYFLTCGIIMLVTLIYRVIILSFKDGILRFDLKNIPLSAFDLPVFTILLAGIFSKGKFHDILSTFNSSFGFLLGVIVLLLPHVTPYQHIGINAQIKLNAVFSVAIAVVNLKSYAKSFKVFDFLMGCSIFFGVLVVIETVELLLDLLLNIESLCYFGHYFSVSLAVFSHLLNAFPHPIATLTLALLVAELSAGVYYVAYRVSTRKKRY